MSIIFYLARHGQSYGNLNGNISGSNPELTPLGFQQAKQLAQKIQGVPLSAIYASTLIRAQQTAAAVATAKNLPLQIEENLKERFFGSLEGKTAEQVQKVHAKKYEDFGNAPLQEQMNWKIVEDEETFSQVMKRVENFLNVFENKESEQHILLVSHANVLVPMLVYLGFASFHELPNGSIQNTGFIKIFKDKSVIKLIGVDGISKKSLLS